MGNSKLKKRHEIDAKYKWDIEKMYMNSSEFEADMDKVFQLAEKFKSLQGNITNSAENLLSSLQLRDELFLIVERLYVYAKMKLDEDNSNAKQQALYGKVLSLDAKVSSTISFFIPEILSADKETVLEYISENDGLKLYEFMLLDLFKEKDHILSEAEENLLAQLSEVTSSTSNIFSMLNDADMKFGTVTDEEGSTMDLTHGNYINFMESNDRNIRKQAYTNMYESYKALINTIATTYNYNVKNDVVKARIRKYSSARAASLSNGNIPEEVYDNLINVVHEYLPVMHKYIELRKKLLGVDELKMYDVYVPLIDIPKDDIDFDAAVEIMMEALAPLGDDYLQILKQAISQRWIDIYENENKTSGAYSFGSYDSYPYVLLNYTNRLQDVFTLVHELGHSLHSYYTRKNQPFIYGDYSIFCAEVASTVNESLLMQYLLNKETDSEKKKYLINMHIEAFRTTLFRQTMFAEFEKLAHNLVAEGETLTADLLCEEYDKLNRLYFGSALGEDEYIKYEWARIPHFYHAFYVYQYATGYSAASAISSKILSEGSEARDAYKKFLATGSSDYPVELLKIAGVDMSKKEPVIAAMETFKKLVDELEKLV